MATLTANKILDSGFSSSMATCTPAGDEFSNTGVEFIRIQNGHASVAYTVKIVAATTTVKHPSYGNLTKSDIYKSVSSSGSTNSNDILRNSRSNCSGFCISIGNFRITFIKNRSIILR